MNEAPAREPTIDARRGMAWVPAGTFRMGSEAFHAEEGPVHRVTLSGFCVLRAPGP